MVESLVGHGLWKDHAHEILKNVEWFAWAPYMLEIDTKMVIHHLAIDPFAKLVARRKQKVYKKKRVAIDEEVGKLSETNFIT